MTQQYDPNNEKEDLSGFLVSQPRQTKKVSDDSGDLSGFLTSQRRSTPVVTTVNRDTRHDDDDLSGFLVSQPHQVQKAIDNSGDLSGFLTNQHRTVPVAKTVSQTAKYDDDEDLSGCLTSGFLRAKKTPPVATPDPVQPDRSNVNEIEIDEDAGSDWLYMN